MKFVTLMAVVLIMFGCGTTDEQNSQVNGSEGDSMQSMGKADDVTQRPATGNEETSASDDEIATPDEDDAASDEETSLADEFDYCGEFELYNDGTCHRFCWEPDPDCDGIEEEETTWDDDACEDGETCEEEDEQEPLSDEYITRLCRGFDQPIDVVEGLADTLCMEREDDEALFQSCIDMCLEAYRNR